MILRAWLSAALLAPALALAAEDGAKLFERHCAACHQADASGTVGLAPPLKGEHWARLGAERSYLPTVLVHGLSGPIQVGALRFVGSMPAFGAQLPDEELVLIANHLRGLQGAADAAPLTAADFAAARAAAGSPPATRLKRQSLLP
ncbi:cytochrome c [Ideonella sp. 4Y16]|uniref:c-type cytochrome n=1 Tax=Ideonella alba TaxID=2824118 RepID=UPI001B38F937|nr:cytochrome c [Ideonella alba]MBQ0944538.1 cytochrome c [Ideonella alba]